MDAYHFRLWRIMWENDVIQVFQGGNMVLNVPMKTCCFDALNVRSISVASESKALWELDNLQGKCFSLCFLYQIIIF